ncbi:hypothetical protein MRX96_039127 [Rhipicephalus microplus]
MGGASLSLEQTGALERRGLFSRFAGRLDGTPGGFSSSPKGDLDLERSRLSVGAESAVCISMEVHWYVLKWSPSELVLLVSSLALEPAFQGAGVTGTVRASSVRRGSSNCQWSGTFVVVWGRVLGLRT